MLAFYSLAQAVVFNVDNNAGLIFALYSVT